MLQRRFLPIGHEYGVHSVSLRTVSDILCIAIRLAGLSEAYQVSKLRSEHLGHIFEFHFVIDAIDIRQIKRPFGLHQRARNTAA